MKLFSNQQKQVRLVKVMIAEPIQTQIFVQCSFYDAAIWESIGRHMENQIRNQWHRPSNSEIWKSMFYENNHFVHLHG